MRFALCFSGQMRSLDQCVTSIRHHLIEPLAAGGANEVDVFVHAAADEDADTALRLDPRILHIEPQPTFDEKLYALRIGRGCVGIQSVLRQLWSIQKSNELKRRYATSRGFRYDCAMRVRPDTEFAQGPLEALRFTPGTRGVWIPKFSNWYGLNDRFAWGSDLEMDLYSNRFDALDHYLAAGGVFHPESFLFWTLAVRRVPIFRSDVAFYTLRKNGDRIVPDFHSEYREALPCFPPPQPDCLDVRGLPNLPCIGDGRPSLIWRGPAIQPLTAAPATAIAPCAASSSAPKPEAIAAVR